ncbi:enoyl-CoA hydratase/isomerase family protein [Parenemella sanctibonifatiensis]|uniref:enoyl-CoA hydratase n=1 Tax=Parenemella sanctibonifatiensis TaxID=2016505 RepID=A0A255EDZ3_9ACTN|nr:enoyl-CoA hydratase/isomerase family protein [Parenemella sanctibonifatiensis]OYN87765.1 enoyl-CoA hydratase [Parenemella sanctibonifatiensis]
MTTADAPTPQQGQVTWQTSEDGQTATILVDRPAKLNAMSLEMIADLHRVVNEIETSDARVVVVRTAGEKVFCVGADIKQFLQLTPVQMHRIWLRRGHEAYDALARLPVPTVAVIDGLALGGGLELALACDIRIISTKAEVGLPEVGLGTIPGWGGVSRLPRLIGPVRAADLVLTRRRLSAQESLDWGICTRIAHPAQLEQETDQLVAELLTASPQAQAVAKELLALAPFGAPGQLGESLGGALTAATDDFAEGTAAFAERRDATFPNA